MNKKNSYEEKKNRNKEMESKETQFITYYEALRRIEEGTKVGNLCRQREEFKPVKRSTRREGNKRSSLAMNLAGKSPSAGQPKADCSSALFSSK